MRSRRGASEASSPFDELIPDLYDALLQPQMWPSVLTRLAKAANVGSVNFLIVDDHGVPCMSELSDGLSEEGHRAYREHYAVLDPRRRLVQAMPTGKFLVCHRHFDEAFVRRSEFYQDFLIPSGVRYLAGVRLDRESGHDALMGFNRHLGESAFEERDLERLQTLLPHLRQVARLHNRMSRLEENASRLSGALDGLASGVVIVDQSLCVRFVNRSAERFLRACDGLLVRDNRLVSLDADTSQKLDRLISQASQCAAGGEPFKGGGALAVRRPSGARPFMVLVAPLPEFSAWRLWRSEPAAVLYITDPEARPQPLAARLAALFGLTRAEARLATHLAAGESLAEIADALALSKHTLRAQLKALMDKTGTRRQAALVRLLSTIAGP
jgi:DNA-binding CsgD family transcriptional regulator